ncbi:MAG: SpoIVB peptidase [Clostridiales bacterium]|nr:SpoIVB peptidase [Clostridiales bacterium]
MKKRRLRGAVFCAALAALALYALPQENTALQVSSAQADGARVLIPGGQVVGVALKTQGVLVVSRVSRQEMKTPLRVGDVILSVQGKDIDSAQELSRRINEVNADSVDLSVLRGGRETTLRAASPVSSADGKRRLGVWVRDSTAGVGTLSYVDPNTQAYGALGHAIVDGDTGDMLCVKDGAIMEADIVGVAKGESGRAGELKGSFLKEGRQIGTLLCNSEYGIYGVMKKAPQDALYPQGLPVGERSQVHEGTAMIISTVDAHGPQAYDVEIVRCAVQDKPGQKSMVLRVTDERLLEKTGGIVQGMSGSPIIQDGKIIGALTHVLVNDPTMGYGIFIETMLDAAA